MSYSCLIVVLGACPEIGGVLYMSTCVQRERERAAKTEKEGEVTQHDCVCSVLAGACLPSDQHPAPLSRQLQCHGSKSEGVITDLEELNAQGGQDILVTRYAKPEDALINKDAIFWKPSVP